MEPAHYPLKPVGMGGNWESLVACPVAGSFQLPLGLMSAAQCSSTDLALAYPEAVCGQAIQ